MTPKTLSCSFGLIGDNLELKQDIIIEIDDKGKISNLKHENVHQHLGFPKEKDFLLLIPGLIISHVHLGDSFAKELGFNKDLIKVVAPPKGLKHILLSQTSDAIKKEGIQQAILEMFSYGTTCFIDFRENGIEGINLLKESIKNSSISALILGRTDNEETIKEVYENAEGIGLSSYKKVSSSIKKELKDLKQKKPKIIACHDAEYNLSEDLFNNLVQDGLIDVIIHGTQYKKEHLELIKKKGISLVLCPRCNGYFGVGFPPIVDILKLRIPISLGTDNVMVNSLDLFEEMRYLYRIARIAQKNNDESPLTAVELLKMVSINAARNFGLEAERGSLEKGKFADFFIIDLKDANYFCELTTDNIYPLIVNRTRSENIKKVYIKGELVFERN